MPQPLRGADIVMRTLDRAGHRTIFTLSGNHIMSLFDAAIDTSLDLVHTRHEAAAVHAADAWGRMTGEPGFAMVTGGPGHANATAALMTAQGQESPLVLLSGHTETNQLGRGGFQELRQAEMAAHGRESLVDGNVGRNARRRRREGDPHRHVRPSRPGASQPAVRSAGCARRRQRGGVAGAGRFRRRTGRAERRRGRRGAGDHRVGRASAAHRRPRAGQPVRPRDAARSWKPRRRCRPASWKARAASTTRRSAHSTS